MAQAAQTANPMEDTLFQNYLQQNQSTINPTLQPGANPYSPTTSPLGVVSQVSDTGTGGGSNSPTNAYPTPSPFQTGAYGGTGALPAAQTPSATTGSANNLSPFSSSMTDDQVRALANQYIQAGGAQNIDNGQYWVTAWDQWGKNDPNYFMTRLQQGITQQGGYNGAFGAVAPSGPNGAPAGVGGGGYSMTTSGIDPTKSNALYDQLMGIAGQSTVVDPNDPTIKAQTDAYNAQTTDAEKNFLSSNAEQASAINGGNVNQGAEARSMAEQGGQAEGAFQGQLMSNELAARRAQIQQALSGAAGLLTAEQQMALNEELSKLDLAQSAYATDQSNLLRASGL